jgi:hypothetical protein
MSWGYVAVAAATVVGGVLSSKGAEKGADAQTRASMAATEEERRQYDQTRQDQMPFLEAGYGALKRQEAVLGGDYSGFESSPDYLFSRDQGLQALERGAAARGGFMGGGADADRMQFASGLANQNLNSYWNKLAGQAGQGQVTAGNLGQLGAQSASNIGNNMISAGQARASSYASQANSWNNALQSGANAFGKWYGGRE